MCYNRGYGETESPSRLSGNENHESELAVTLAYLALYVRTEIKGIIREVLLLKKYHERHSLSAISKKLLE